MAAPPARRARGDDHNAQMLEALDVVKMVSFWHDVQSRTVIWKGALCKSLGIKCEEDAGHLFDRIHPYDLDTLVDARAMCGVDYPEYSATYRFRVNDNDFCWLREDGKALFDDNGYVSHFVGVCREETDIQDVDQDFDWHQRTAQAVTRETSTLIAYVDSSLRYRFANDVYAAEFGRSPRNIIGQTVPAVLGEANFRQAKPHLEAALSGQRGVYEIALKTPGAEETHFKEVTYVPQYDARGNVDGCHVIAIDVTQQKHDAFKAIERENQLRLALQTARMGVWEWDVKNDQVRWSDSLCEIFGYPEGLPTPTCEGFVSLVHPDDRRALRKRIQSAHTGTCEGFEVEYRFIHGETGEIIWTFGTGAIRRDENGEVESITGVVKDASRQKRADEELAANERRLQRVIDGASVGIAFANSDGDVRTANDAALRLLGIRRSEFSTYGCCWTDLARRVDQKNGHAILKELKSSEQISLQEFVVTHPDGSTHPVQISAMLVSEDIDEFVVFLVDLSDQKDLQHSLDEARRLAETANQTKSEFLANMSHEIRTPMSAIIGYLDILSRNITEPDDLKSISVIRRNSHFLLEIINDILDISKIEAGKIALHKKRFRPEKLLTDVQSLMEVRAAEKNLAIELKVDGQLPKTIRTDDKRLKQILVNLIGNAIKFTEEGSIELKVWFNSDLQRICFAVIDTGIGMAPRMLKKLFQPFTQGDSSLNREFGGTGLGLNISQRLANLLGGEIVANSELGVGSEFTLSIAVGSLNNIPMVVPDLSVRQSTTYKPQVVELQDLNGRILVVDDRKDIRFIAQHFLEQSGANVSVAENGQEAIRIIHQAQADAKTFDLIVMDMQMPVLDGYAATRKLRKSGFNQPIVALTAHAMSGDRQRCLDAGCTDYLTKPLDRSVFVNLIASHMPSTAIAEETSRTRILIVEDFVEAADSLATLLELSNHIVEKAYDGTSAIEKAASFQPDVVLLDLGLPDMTGFEVLSKIRKAQSIDSSSCFIAMTGREDSEETMKAGFVHHVVKPVDLRELELLLASCGEGK